MLHAFVVAALKKAGVRFTRMDRIALEVRLYLPENELLTQDVDNRLKDIMDALQGRVGGTKSKKGRLRRLIPNDNQVYRATVEKSLPPKQSHGRGHLVIRTMRRVVVR
jgi:Holliday junction resolvase RusA-like endonuclease